MLAWLGWSTFYILVVYFLYLVCLVKNDCRLLLRCKENVIDLQSVASLAVVEVCRCGCMRSIQLKRGRMKGVKTQLHFPTKG